MFLIVIPLLAVCVGLYLYAAGGRYVSTDNAYVKANVIIISPESVRSGHLSASQR